LTGFSTEQLQSVALVLLKVNSQGTAVAVAFFGLEGVVRGYLIMRSTFLPRWLGVLSMISASGWLTFFYPPLGRSVFVVVALLALLVLGILIFWLMVFGVNEERWKEQALR
jgi:hypothetical protein